MGEADTVAGGDADAPDAIVTPIVDQSVASEVDGEPCQLGPMAPPGLVADGVQVRVDGGQGDYQLAGDVLVGDAAPYHREDLALTATEVRRSQLRGGGTDGPLDKNQRRVGAQPERDRPWALASEAALRSNFAASSRLQALERRATRPSAVEIRLPPVVFAGAGQSLVDQLERSGRVAPTALHARVGASLEQRQAGPAQLAELAWHFFHVIDMFARRIVGWKVSASLETRMALDALEMAIWSRHVTASRGWCTTPIGAARTWPYPAMRHHSRSSGG